MKRIAFLLCGMLLLISNTAEARRARWTRGTSYTQPAQFVPAATTATEATSAKDARAATEEDVTPDTSVQTTSATAEDSSSAPSVQLTSATTAVPVRTASYSTSTAQGVAHLMASNNRVGHWGGNPGYEGCGCGATPAAAYAICCYGNSGMATVDVGYAQSASGMWYCCRRYR
jgi:hypothetical protein